MHRIRYLFAAVIFAFASTTSAIAEKKVALVIGNAAYMHTTALNSPVHDAEAMGDTLKRLGFKVVVSTNLNRDGIVKAIRTFEKEIQGASTGLFYYSGHGLQVNGQNYVVPINAKLESKADVHFEMVRVDAVLKLMTDNKRKNIVFLDACRDNPLGKGLSKSLGGGKGLAQIDATGGTLISFATNPGNVAYDGIGNANNSKYSIFTAALLDNIETKNIDIAELLRRVRRQVKKMTDGGQTPWENSSLTENFFFNKVADSPVKEQTAKSIAGAKRFALLVGNQQYKKNIGALKNPYHDIDLVGKSLKKIGFDVTSIKDAGRNDILTGITKYVRKVGAAGEKTVSFLYYSGHGAADIEEEKNYLIPVDVPSTEEDILWDSSVPLSKILSRLRLRAENAYHFVVFDACREELVPQGSKSISRGFVAEEPKKGMFVAFSTSPGKRASDIGDAGGPYAAALAGELQKEGQSHLELFHNVRLSVAKETGGYQVPWTRDQLLDRVYFTKRPDLVISKTEEKKSISQVTPIPTPVEEVGRAFEQIKNSDDPDELEAFLQSFNVPFYTYQIKKRLRKLRHQ